MIILSFKTKIYRNNSILNYNLSLKYDINIKKELYYTKPCLNKHILEESYSPIMKLKFERIVSG
jgi:hypothetical protein